MRDGCDVVVVGAGLAGLVAATERLRSSTLPPCIEAIRLTMANPNPVPV